MRIYIPATLANFGPGVQSIGFPLNVGVTIEVGEETEQWRVQHPFADRLTHDETNYVVQIATNLAPNIKPHALTITSTLPTTKGLGWQDALILGGIELGNQLGQLALDDFTKLTLAARTAKQPAHVAAALLGQPAVSYLQAGDVYASGFVCPTYAGMLYIPDEIEAISFGNPETIDYDQGVAAAAGGNMLMAAWQNQQVELAGQLLENDRLQQIFTKDNHALQAIRQAAHALDIYGTVLIEQGPIIATLLPQAQVQDFKDVLAYVELPGHFEQIEMTDTGLSVGE